MKCCFYCVWKDEINKELRIGKSHYSKYLNSLILQKLIELLCVCVYIDMFCHYTIRRKGRRNQT